MKIRHERRERISIKFQLAAYTLAVIASFGIISLLLFFSGINVISAFYYLFYGAFGTTRLISETLLKSIPLLIVGLAMVVAFEAKVWNIGAEGQLYIGALVGTVVALFLPIQLGPLLLVALVAGGILGGALWSFVPAILKAKMNVNEVITTLMMNYVALYFMNYLMYGPWRDPNTFMPQSPLIPESARLLRIPFAGRLHIGFLIAIMFMVIVYFFIRRSKYGYNIRLVGSNPEAARYAGINVDKYKFLALFLSGAIAGIAGAFEIAGVQFRFRPDFSPGYGYVGIIIALLAALNPIAVVFASILFGGLIVGGDQMQISAGVSIAAVSAIQAIILLFVLMVEYFKKYRIILSWSE